MPGAAELGERTEGALAATDGKSQPFDAEKQAGEFIASRK